MLHDKEQGLLFLTEAEEQFIGLEPGSSPLPIEHCDDVLELVEDSAAQQTDTSGFGPEATRGDRIVTHARNFEVGRMRLRMRRELLTIMGEVGVSEIEAFLKEQ